MSSMLSFRTKLNLSVSSDAAVFVSKQSLYKYEFGR